MLVLKIAVVVLVSIVMIRAFIGIRKYRPSLWESYEAEGIPLALVKQRLRVYRVLFPVMGMVNGALIAFFFLIPYGLSTKTHLLKAITIISQAMLLTSSLFIYIASRPNCDWIFNCQNEIEEKNRKMLRRLSLFIMFMSACVMLNEIIWG